MDPQTAQPQLTPAQTAMQALIILGAMHPYFTSEEKHKKGWECIDVVGKFIQDKMRDEAPASASAPAPESTPAAESPAAEVV